MRANFTRGRRGNNTGHILKNMHFEGTGFSRRDYCLIAGVTISGHRPVQPYSISGGDGV